VGADNIATVGAGVNRPIGACAGSSSCGGKNTAETKVIVMPEIALKIGLWP
jgi:hypothetical protein